MLSLPNNVVRREKWVLLKRGLEVLKTEGFGRFAMKVRRFLIYKTVNSRAARLEGGVNGAKYWDLRMRKSWRAVGGHEQTQSFCVSMLANLNISQINPSTILDFGCATGDSAPILYTAFPDATIYLHDISVSGVDQGLRRYESYIPIRRWQGEQIDLLYTSNVIEHFEDPHAFFDLISKAAPKHVIVQCPWEERFPDGSRITPEHPNGEHFQTIDQEFVHEFIPKGWTVLQMTTGKAPLAWPFGHQLYILLKTDISCP